MSDLPLPVDAPVDLPVDAGGTLPDLPAGSVYVGTDSTAGGIGAGVGTDGTSVGTGLEASSPLGGGAGTLGVG